MKISKTKIEHFLMPQKCPVCREPLPLDSAGAFLCPICRSKIEFEKQKICKVCGQRAIDCLCKPKILKDANSDLLKLMFYEADSGGPSDRLVMYLKHFKDKRVFDYISDMLLSRLSEVERGISDEPQKYLFTFVPRSRKARVAYGFDQSEILAKMLAKRTGAAFAPTVKRSVFGKRQKELDYKKREKNAKKIFYPKGKVDLLGKIVVLVDDISTSGASMSVCAGHIKNMGAERVVFLAVCMTEPKENKKA